MSKVLSKVFESSDQLRRFCLSQHVNSYFLHILIIRLGAVNVQLRMIIILSQGPYKYAELKT